MIDIEKAKDLFKKYTDNYDHSNPRVANKIAHSYRVSSLARTVAESLNLPEDEVELAELIGLLHDIGRFEQVRRYNTFFDLQSVDHADLGVEILEENNYINKYCDDKELQTIILKAVKNHNKFAVEEGLSERELLHAKIIRDADKLDIFYLFSIYKQKEPPTGPLSKKIEESFWRKELVNRKYIVTESDRQLQKIALIFDINFRKSFEIVKEKGYVEKVADNLYLSEDIKNFANKYVEEKLNEQ